MTADPDLDLVHVAAAETVMTNEVVAVMMIVVARKRANPGTILLLPQLLLAQLIYVSSPFVY